jgi:hypothetical protein
MWPRARPRLVRREAVEQTRAARSAEGVLAAAAALRCRPEDVTTAQGCSSAHPRLDGKVVLSTRSRRCIPGPRPGIGFPTHGVREQVSPLHAIPPGLLRPDALRRRARAGPLFTLRRLLGRERSYPARLRPVRPAPAHRRHDDAHLRGVPDPHDARDAPRRHLRRGVLGLPRHVPRRRGADSARCRGAEPFPRALRSSATR